MINVLNTAMVATTGKVHNLLLRKSRRYYHWHQNPRRSLHHLYFLILSLFILAVFVSVIIIPRPTYAASKSWVGTSGGSWTTSSNWSPSGVPATGDIVTIPADQSAAITSVPDISLDSLTISGNVNFRSSAGSGSYTTMTVTSAFSVAAGKTVSFGTSDTGRLNFTLASGATGTINGTAYMNSYSGSGYDRTFTNSGNLTISSAGLIDGENTSLFVLSSGATLQIANSAGITTSGTTGAVQVPGTRTYSTGANYIYNGNVNQATGNGLPTTVNNFTVNNTGTSGNNIVTLGGTIAVNGNLEITAGIFATNNNAVTLNGNFTNSGTFTAGSSAITIGGTATQSIGAFTTTGTVSMTKTGGTATFTGNVNGAGLTTNGSGGTLNLGTGLTHTFTGGWTRSNGTLNGGSSTIKFGGDASGSTGTFTAGTGTVGWNGAGAQVCASNSMTYNNLLLSGGGAKSFGNAITVNGIFSIEGTTTATLTGDITYGAAATLQYKGSALQTTSTEFPATFGGSGGVIIDNASGVNLGGSKTITNALTLTNGALGVGTNTLTLNGSVINTSGSLTSSATGTVIYGSASSQTIIAANYGNLTSSGAGARVLASSGTIGIAGVFTIGTNSYTNTGSTVNYNGTAQTVGAIAYNNLTLSGSGAKTMTSVSTIGGNFALSSTASATATSALTIGGNVSIGGSNTFNGGTGLTHNVAGNWSNSGTFTAGTSTINFNGATQAINNNNTFYNLSITGTATRTVTLQSGATQTVSNNLTLTGASSNLLTLAASASPTKWLISAPATQTVNYISPSYSDASGGTTINAVGGTGNIDGGNNTNWNFDATPPIGTITLGGGATYWITNTSPTIALTTDDASEYQLCLNSATAGNNCTSVARAWASYTATPTAYDFSAQGSQTLYVQFKDAYGNISATFSDSITIDTVVPTVTQVTPVPSPTSDTTPDYTFNTTEAGTITYGGDCSSATTSATSGNNTITFNTLGAGAHSNCTIKVTDAAGNQSSNLSVNSFTIDSTAPTAAITYSDPDGIVKAGDSLTITATFSEAMADSPVVKIAISGSNTLAATNMTKTDTTHYTYVHTVGAGNGTATVAMSIGTDTVGNIITSAPTSGATFTVDNTAPNVTQVTPVPSPTSDTTPDYTFNTTEAGTITYGGDCSSATTSATSGNNTITFNALSAGAHSNCTIKVTDAAGNQSSNLNVNSFTIDSTAPTISSATLTTSTSSYGPASTINITLNFSEAVSSAGLTITLNTGATINTGALTNQSSYSGTYTVGAAGSGQNTNDLSVFSVTGTITDGASNPTVNPTIPGGQNINNSKDIKVDTTLPAISSATSTTANGSYGPTSAINITLNFNEAVDSAAGLSITLNTGAVINTGALSNQSSFSGTYTVGATGSGQTTSDLAVSSVTGTLVDRTVNNANSNASLSVPGGSNISNSKDIIIDTTAPVLQNITSTTSNGTYGATASINITANYNENIKSAGSSLNITLNNGKTLVLNGVSGSSISATYTVGAIGSGEDMTGLDVAAITAATILDNITNPNTDSNTTIPADNNLIDFRTINIDTTLATVAITAPTKVATGSITDTTIHVTDNQGILNTNVVVDASSTATTSDLNCTQTDSTTVYCTIHIDSSGNLVMKATDGGGNIKTQAENSYLIDSTDPVIAITAPTKTSGSSITNTTIHVTDGQGILAANVTVDASTTATTSSFNCTQTNSTTVDCTISIDSSGNLVIKAIDGATNDATEAENSYVIDTASPVVVITAPTKTSQSTISNTTIQVTDTDGILAANVIVDPSTTAGTGNFDCTQTDAYTVDCTIDITSSGNLTIKATDGGGNIDTATETGYLVDNVLPNITITAPTKTKNTSITNTTIHVTDDQGILNTNVTVDASSTATTSDLVCTQTNSTTVDCTIHIDSSGNLVMKAIDGTLNTRTVSENSYIIEAVNPVIAITAPSKISNSEVTNTTIHVTDNNGILVSGVTVDVSTTLSTHAFNCTQVDSKTVNCTIHIIGIGDLSIKAIDNAGNSIITTETGYVVSDDAPAVSFDAPNKYSNAPITNTTINITDAHGVLVSGVAIDASNTVSYNSFSCLQTDTNTVDCTINITSSGDLAISATDIVTNNSVATESGYIIDMVDPVIAITAPTKTAGATISDTTIHITDNGAIFTGGITVSPSTTVSYNNFDCTQTDSSTVDCTIEITGSGNLVIRAEDGASNDATQNENGYIVDMTNPIIGITAPDKLSNSAITTTTIHVTDNVGILLANVTIDPSSTAGVSGFVCSQTNATTVDCTLNITTSGNLVIKAIDGLANDITQAENNYIIDTAGPVIAITAPTKSSNAAIENTTIHITDNNEVLVANVSVDGTTTINDYDSFDCTQTNSKTVDCTIRLLSSGNLVIEALDLVSNTSHQAENGYTISIVAPVVVINAPTKASSINITDTTIHITDADGVLNTDVTIDPATTVSYSGFDCTQTDSDTVDCTITITSSGNLKIKAIDSLTNEGNETESGYVIDTVSPETTLTSTPDFNSTSASASFSFEADESATFKCKIDSSSYTTCSSPKNYTGLANGSHTFYVYAIDLAGNSDATPEEYTWTITVQQGGGSSGNFVPADTTPPTDISILIDNGENSTSSVNVNLTLTATDAVSMMISNGADFTGRTWEAYATLKSWALTAGNGTKTVYAKFRDAAGNVSSAVSDSIILDEVISIIQPEIFPEFEPEILIEPQFENLVQNQSYGYELLSQSPYPSTLKPGETVNVWIEVRNTGTAAWGSNVRLGTGSQYGNSNQQRDYESEFVAYDWLSPNRPTSFLGLTSTGLTSLSNMLLDPGQEGKAQFTIQAPSEPGVYKAYFTPVVDGVTWMSDIGLYWEVTVIGDIQLEPVVQPQPEVSQPEPQPVPVVEPAPVIQPQTEPQPIFEATPKVPSGEFGYYEVLPGDDLQWIAQKIYGDKGKWARLVELNQDSYTNLYLGGDNVVYSEWLLKYDILAPLLNYDYEIIDQSPYPSTLSAGEEIIVWIKIKNTGTATWFNSGKSPVRLGTGSIYGSPDQQQDYDSEFANSDWIAPNRCTAINLPEVKPGEVARLQFKIKAPEQTGTYKSYFTPVVDGIIWMKDMGIYWEIQVK